MSNAKVAATAVAKSSKPKVSRKVVIMGLLLLLVGSFAVIIIILNSGDEETGNGVETTLPNNNIDTSTTTITTMSIPRNQLAEGPPCVGGLSQPGCSIDGGDSTVVTHQIDCPFRFVPDSSSSTGYTQCIWDTTSSTCGKSIESTAECSPVLVNEKPTCAIPQGGNPNHNPWFGEDSSSENSALQQAFRAMEQLKCGCPETYSLENNDNLYNWRCLKDS